MLIFFVGPQGDNAQLVFALLAVEFCTAEDRNLFKVVSYSNAPRKVRCGEGRTNLEYLRSLEEEMPLFGVVQVETGEVDKVLIRFDLSEIGEHGHVECQVGCEWVSDVEAELEEPVTYTVILFGTR